MVTNVSVKFNYNRLRTDKASGNLKSDNNNKNNKQKKNKNNVRSARGPFPSPKTKRHQV